jgi:hypothetical protein
MRLHSDKVTREDIRAALAQAGAYVPGHEIAQHGSRKRARAYDIKLRGSSARRPNFYDGSGDYAATWDQWGVFLGHLYRIDPDMIAGDQYTSAAHYNARTFGRFAAPGMPEDAHGDHKFDSEQPHVQKCRKCSARTTWNPDKVAAGVS